MTTPKPLIAGNWKMNGLFASAAELDAVAAGLVERGGRLGAGAPEALICPPATLIAGFAERARSAQAAGAPLGIGGQDCHAAVSGAHTGDLSAEMLADAGAGAVIVGHSERRADHGESDAAVRDKAAAALGAGLRAIVCLGESLGEREAGQALAVITGQLAASLPDVAPETAAEKLVIAYEPIWAIGSGKTPTVPEIAEAHQALQSALVARFGPAGARIPVLYGGSVKPGNAAEILAIEAVSGALVGGASLKATDFLAIYDAA